MSSNHGIQLAATVVIFALSLAACRTTKGGDSAVKVVNGTPVEAGSNYALSTVGLTGAGAGSIGCTGTLVVDRFHVVTAKHCIQPLIQRSSDGCCVAVPMTSPVSIPVA